jgi:hypothetical protein
MCYHYSSASWTCLLELIELAGRDVPLRKKLEDECLYRLSRGWQPGREDYCPRHMFFP